ncbi:MAG: hypothetical protein WC831_05130 [Parcubacteria group bacterium]
MDDVENIRKNILSTLIYYNILDFPLTSFEIWKYLTAAKGDAGEKKKVSLGDIYGVLESGKLGNRIEEYRGFYFLRGRKKLVGIRIQNDKNSIEKLKISEKVAWWLRFAPFVRMVAVTGTLAMKNTEPESDIDYFIILKKGRIFTGRLLVTAMAHILGRRRHGRKIKNRICLNYYIADNSLEIKRQDLFAANEYTFVFPLYGFYLFRKFLAENAGWIRKYKPNWEIPEIAPARYYVGKSSSSRLLQKAGETLINSLGGDRIEAWLKRKQINRIEGNILTKKEGAYVEADDYNLIFLPEPQGPRIEEKYETVAGEIYSENISYDESFG